MPVNYCTEACDFIFRGKGKTSAWIRRTARTEGWDTGAVSVVFCSDERLLEINNKDLNHNYFTDIITFDYSDPEKKKISLGYKTDDTNPWTIFTREYHVGDVVDVKIVKLMTFGAFAEIIPGVDGLIHISQIADRRIGKPEDVLSEGQEVQAKIIDIDEEHKRISLSIRALLNADADEEEDAE